MKKSVFVKIVETKMDHYGNVYRVAVIFNGKNQKFFAVMTPDESNIRSILFDALGGWENFHLTIITTCTGSTKTKSLPAAMYLNECSYDKAWQKQLKKIGLKTGVKNENPN